MYKTCFCVSIGHQGGGLLKFLLLQKKFDYLKRYCYNFADNLN